MTWFFSEFSFCASCFKFWFLFRSAFFTLIGSYYQSKISNMIVIGVGFFGLCVSITAKRSWVLPSLAEMSSLVLWALTCSSSPLARVTLVFQHFCSNYDLLLRFFCIHFMCIITITCFNQLWLSCFFTFRSSSLARVSSGELLFSKGCIEKKSLKCLFTRWVTNWN